MGRRSSCQPPSARPLNHPLLILLHPSTRMNSLALLLLTMPFPTAEVLHHVPTQFQGTWAQRPEQCGNRTGEMHIGPRSIEVGARRGWIVSMVSHGRYEAALIVQWRATTSESLWAAAFTLSEDEMSLSDTASAYKLRWIKCRSSAS